MNKRVIPALAAGCLMLAGPAAAARSMTQNVHIVRTAGTCPASIAVRTTAVPFEGGATYDVTATTFAVAFVSELVIATPKRIEFRAGLRPAYASCAGTGRYEGNVFTLHGGKLGFVINNSISSGTYPHIIELDVKGGNPHVSMGIAD
jgi:hypothetical protein